MRSILHSNSRADQNSLFPTRLLSILLAMGMTVQSLATVRAFSWDTLSPTVARNITSMVAAYPYTPVTEVIAKLNALPAGKRVLLMLGAFTDRLAAHPADACMTIDASGKVTRTSFPGPWCSVGAAEVKANVTKFFDALQKGGVKGIDALVLDNETTFWAGRYITADGSNTRAIEADPRFPALAKRMGVTTLNKLAWGGREYYRWCEVVAGDFDAALNNAVCVPFRSKWPNGVTCNYGEAPITTRYMTPDMGGLGIVNGGKGYGTHNSMSFYGNSLHWIQGAAFAGTTLNDSAFDMFRLNVHRIRACNASSARKMMPWIANYSLGCNGEGLEPGGDFAAYYSAIANTKYWDENMIQLAMHGCDTMLLFNPAAWRPGHNPAIWNKVSDQERCSSMIDLINNQLGAAPGASRWFSLPGLQDRVMATGRRVTGGTMWRFSFAPGVASVTVAMKNGDVREIVPESGEVGAWLFEADNNPFAVKADGSDIAFAEAPAGAAWPDLDDSGELDQGDIALLLLDMNERGSPFDINGDGVVTSADVSAFKAIQKNWYAQSTKGRTAMEGSVLVTAAR